ncbi:hypothetical protein [Streptomyces sp. NBC_00986]|uniref:hypothetical protein n=1 Tax=Streptomyces sp. NBC_00986 TaxID=2903702 RepID=UPI00386E1D45|nr:hypothetical protein OG504_34465 [Streptomyces sp. NBC_00986]
MGQEKRAARRAAGTLTGVDVLLRWMWIRRRTSAQDIEDFENGQALLVAGFTKSIGGAAVSSVGKGKQIARLRSGQLRLAPGEEPVWTDRRGDRTASLRPPFSLKPTGVKLPLGPKFERYELVTADGTFDLALPKKDRELVRHVFEAK